jgi:acetylornithine/N-succinyldiaminopimelate aminotransferase
MELLEAASNVMMPTYAPLPIVPDHGHGSRIVDTDGTEYVDLGGGIAVTSLGHSSPELKEALFQQADKLWHVSNVFATEPAIRLAERLIELTFADRVFFSNSGAEANEAALKLARRHAYNNGEPDRYEIVSLEGSFHGRTLFTVSAGGNPNYSTGFGPALEGLVHVRPNDTAALRAAVSERTCAIIVEPILGEGGVRPLDHEYLQTCRDLCDQHGALLIFDEVQTGIGRTGSLFAYQQSGVIPDVLTSAKSLGGGMPIGATLAAGSCAQALTRATHGTTFGGNPLACAVAGAVLDQVTSVEIRANVADRNRQLVEGLGVLGAPTGLFSEVRGAGLLLGAELTPAFQDRAKEIQIAALSEGVVILVAGSNVLRFAPALNITESEVADGLDRLALAVAKVVAA